tara:strand:- start:66099 stop:66962 length:864 start_codon:yes stop_codon:yes gene_type:complete
MQTYTIQFTEASQTSFDSIVITNKTRSQVVRELQIMRQKNAVNTFMVNITFIPHTLTFITDRIKEIQVLSLPLTLLCSSSDKRTILTKFDGIDTLKSLLRLICTQYDPLPDSALIELQNLYIFDKAEIDFLFFKEDATLQSYLIAKQHAEAIEFALRCYQLNPTSQLVQRLYALYEQEPEWFELLASQVPTQHPYSAQAINELSIRAREHDAPTIKQLTTYFTQAFNSSHETANNLYNELCGGTGLNGNIDIVSPPTPAEKLVAAAAEVRALRLKINRLKATVNCAQ